MAGKKQAPGLFFIREDRLRPDAAARLQNVGPGGIPRVVVEQIGEGLVPDPRASRFPCPNSRARKARPDFSISVPLTRGPLPQAVQPQTRMKLKYGVNDHLPVERHSRPLRLSCERRLNSRSQGGLHPPFLLPYDRFFAEQDAEMVRGLRTGANKYSGACWRPATPVWNERI